MGVLTILFGVHNHQLKCYVINEETKERKAKILAFFGESVTTNTAFWDKKQHEFLTTFKGVPISTAEKDNGTLRELKKALENTANTCNCQTPEQLFKCWSVAKDIQNNANGKPKTTLLDWVIEFRNMWQRNEIAGFENESGNYVIYDKLIHKLQGTHKGKLAEWADEAKRFADMPVTAINSKTFREWADFLCRNGLGFRDSINAFRAAVYYYQRVKLGNEEFCFASITKALKNKKTITHRPTREALTNKEFDELLHFDITRLETKAKQTQLMLDTALLMYAFNSRPYDIISIRIEDLTYNEEKQWYEWFYKPLKKTNHKDKQGTQNRVLYAVPSTHSIATEIVNKYKGKRKSGYLLPYKCNQTDGTPQQRKAPVNHVATKIGNLLKEIATVCNWGGVPPTFYTMRKTALTDQANNKVSIEVLAARAKTSPEELRSVYFSMYKLACG